MQTSSVLTDGLGYSSGGGGAGSGISAKSWGGGGGYGGEGGTVNSSGAGAYGSLTQPTDLGSGGRRQPGSSGGGAIALTVGGSLQGLMG